MLHEELTEKIIESFYLVYNKLGYGFLESVYENALLIELKRQGLNVVNQVPIEVQYRNQKVGTFFADVLVEEKVILELKSSRKLLQEHEFQLINYLRATNIEVGLLFNFGKKPEFKRKIFSNKS
ncbi:GxxExxY protein [Gracilimonas sediminicola]|uniref:GxxExxY protein n=1 Tax=Gracilimonas sediminicola TaxID=2952158 RepID=A0A9X2L1B2_9BACT|nr:GxxExxY protein [Gracilimonas sediminicola]MCP9290447.1 GxxExxY protein [Gracilimonas sediminicola]